MPTQAFGRIVALALAGAVLFAASAHASRSIEDAIETTSNYISLPVTETGYWTFQICSGCSSQIVKLDKNSKFFVGTNQVSLEALRKFANSGGPHSLTVFYRSNDQVLTRIVIDN